MLSKRLSRVAAGILSGIFVLSLCSGCAVSASPEEEAAEALVDAMSEINSCDASVVFEMVARIGATSSSNGHTASIGSDITLSTVFEPFSCHGEYYSQILVDGVRTREDQEFYMAMEDSDYVVYDYQMETEEWHRSTLTRAETMAMPLQSGLIQDWGKFFTGFQLVDEELKVEGCLVNEFSGKVSSSYIQEVMGYGIYGSFLYSMEYLLNDEIPCTLYLDVETGLPVQLIFEFSDEFTVSDMIIENAAITVTYSGWNETHSIEVPKKVSVVASDPAAEFYVSYFAWDLFLPYILGESESNNGNGNGNVSFTSNWDTFQMRLDNVMTSVPIKYENLKTLGYYIDDYYTTTIIEPNSVIKNVPVMKGQDTIYCAFYNPGTSPQPISACTVGSLDFIAADILQNGVSVFLPGEVTLGITLESLLAAYGDADLTTNGFAVDTYTWKGETENQSFYAEVSPNTGLVVRVCITNIPLSSEANSIVVSGESGDLETPEDPDANPETESESNPESTDPSSEPEA